MGFEKAVQFLPSGASKKTCTVRLKLGTEVTLRAETETLPIHVVEAIPDFIYTRMLLSCGLYSFCKV